MAPHEERVTCVSPAFGDGSLTARRPKDTAHETRAERPFDRQASADPGSDDSGVPDSSFPPDELRAQLQRILDSPAFEASERRKRFLRYIVDESLAGRADRLKGYSIATAVFERDESFDPQTDPVVRLEARRLRRALEHYYLTAGRDDPVRIEIPKGSYAPICERQVSASATSAPTPPARASGPTDARPLPPRRARPSWQWLAAGVVAVFLSAALAWAATTSSWLTRTSADRDGTLAAADLQLAGPAVVVAPFENLSGTEAGRLLAGGLTQELVTDLMRFKDLRVYAANSNQRWAQDPVGFGDELQVAYEVKGSVLRAPDQIRLAVQLLEVRSGRYVWSETYERPLTAASIFDIQEEIAAGLAGRLAKPHGIIHEITADLFRRHRPSTLFAYDCVLQAYAYRRTFDREDYWSARGCLEQAIRDDPRYPLAWAMLAFAHLDEYRWYGWGPLYRQPTALDQALVAAQRAKDLDPDDVMTLTAYAAVQFYRGAFGEAEAAQRRAVALNPNNPEPVVQLGWRLAFAGHWNQGIQLVRRAVERSQAGGGWYHLFLAMDNYRRGDYQSGLAELKRLGGTFFFVGPALIAMCEAQLGHQAEAHAALQEAIALDPTFAQDPRGAFRLHRAPEDLIDQFIDGLRRAGLDVPAA